MSDEAVRRVNHTDIRKLFLSILCYFSLVFIDFTTLFPSSSKSISFKI